MTTENVLYNQEEEKVAKHSDGGDFGKRTQHYGSLSSPKL
jgi:hypothetical protein